MGEVAEYLKLAEKTIHRMIGRNEIPCAKVGNQWRFIRSMIDDWLLSNMRTVPENDLARLLREGIEMVPASRLIDEEFFIPHMKTRTRAEAFAELVEPLSAAGFVRDHGRYAKKLEDRELLSSTAIGHGFALPHLRNPRENPLARPLIVTGISQWGVDFGSHDTAPTHLFLLIFTDSEVVHIRILARLTRLLMVQDTVSALVLAVGRQEFLSAFLEAEKKLTLSPKKEVRCAAPCHDRTRNHLFTAREWT